MPLSVGDRLGPYEILAPIGAGGMGEVYRAKDTKLDRDVAIKVLPAALAQDPERLARFEREAKVLAALNHPNIAQIYGVEEHALVMELVPGESLRGPLSLETALNHARQIADALEAAHEKGIVHRDLKPANIMITPGGVVKVLDFGLAAVAQSSDPSNPANSPTLTISPTRSGMILGTAAYMSPEQARGQAVDKRADIWAFGVVLFELLTGKRLFDGETVSDTLAAVLKTEPDLNQVPAKVRRLLEACLQKDAKQRLQAIGDWRLLLMDVQAEVIDRSGSRFGWVAAALAALIAGGLGFGWWRAMQPVERPQVRLDVDLGQDIALEMNNGSSNVIISPDGTRLAYLATVIGRTGGAGRSKLFIRRLDQPKGVDLPGTEGANSPFFSPDSQWVGFTVGGGLNKISVEGGAAVPLSEPGFSSGSSWGEDGNITTGTLYKGLLRTPSGGGAATLATELGGAIALGAPQVLPGGKAILYSVSQEARSDPDLATVEVLSLPDHGRRIVAHGGISARYLATSSGSGYLVYANKSTLFAVPFDLPHLETRGTPVPVLDDVGFSPRTYESQFDVSRTGTMVYWRAAGFTEVMTTIQWVDSAGKRQPLASKPGGYRYVRLSPDGGRLAADVSDGGASDIRVYDLKRETWTQLSMSGGLSFDPAWSPDGQFVVFGSYTGMYWARADGSSPPQPLSTKLSFAIPGSMTPDGKRLAFSEANGNAAQLWSLPLDSAGGQLKAGAPEQFLKSAFNDAQPLLSPDGKWLAYESSSSGIVEIYVRPFPAGGGLWKISNSGGRSPIWSGNGHDLLYEAGDQEMAVSYSAKGGAFVAEKPRVWVGKVGGTARDLSPDGKRLLVVAPVESPVAAKAEHEVVLFQNFIEYLRRRVPTGN
jgi:Tol biopolymer transport system component/predicted Ser/Thr protein kinase